MGTIANAGIKGPIEDTDSSGALDLTFAVRDRGHHRRERQIRSTVHLKVTMTTGA
jgi:hypothetical protein